MNPELIDELKNKYKTFLTTEEGRKRLMEAIAIKKVWIQNKGEVANSTMNLNLKYINKELHNKITKIEITPIGLNNMCHLTSEFFCDDKKQITKRFGYNITACPCGKRMSYELHSVNKYKETLYDFTKDFNDEKNKYFLELNTNMPIRRYINLFGNEPFCINKGCKCNINWNSNLEIIKESELIENIYYIENEL